MSLLFSGLMITWQLLPKFTASVETGVSVSKILSYILPFLFLLVYNLLFQIEIQILMNLWGLLRLLTKKIVGLKLLLVIYLLQVRSKEERKNVGNMLECDFECNESDFKSLFS